MSIDQWRGRLFSSTSTIEGALHILVTQRDKLGLKPYGGNNNDMMVTSMTTTMVTTWAVKMTLLILLLMMIVKLAIGPTTPSLPSAGAA